MANASLQSARLSYAAAVIACIMYGMYIVLALICIHFLLSRKKNYRSRNILLAYTVLMLVVNTIYFVTGSVWAEIEFVESTASIGAYDTALSSVTSILKDTFYVIDIWLADSLLTYRLWILWGGNLLVIAVPCILWAATIGAGIALLVATANPNAQLTSTSVIHLLTTFYSLTVSLNVICTVLIAGYLWHQHCTIQKYKAVRSFSYTSVVTVLVESAALYSIAGLVYIPLVVRKLPLQFPITAFVGGLTGISPNLIVLRMALGTAAVPTDVRGTHGVGHSGSVALQLSPLASPPTSFLSQSATAVGEGSPRLGMSFSSEVKPGWGAQPLGIGLGAGVGTPRREGLLSESLPSVHDCSIIV